jgi:hypothetical protein
MFIWTLTLKLVGNQRIWQFFVGSNLSLPSLFCIFEKYYFDKFLVEQQKSDDLFKNACRFPEKNILDQDQNQEKAQNFLNSFFIILDCCFTSVHTQKLILEH